MHLKSNQILFTVILCLDVCCAYCHLNRDSNILKYLEHSNQLRNTGQLTKWPHLIHFLFWLFLFCFDIFFSYVIARPLPLKHFAIAAFADRAN